MGDRFPFPIADLFSKLKGFIAKCRNDDGGYGVTPGSPSTVSGTYYAAIVTYWLQ